MTGRGILAIRTKVIAGLVAAAALLWLAGCARGAAVKLPNTQSIEPTRTSPVVAPSVSITVGEGAPDPVFAASLSVPPATPPPPHAQFSSPNLTKLPADARVAQATTVEPTSTILPLCLPAQFCPEGQHFWLGRPFGPEYVNYVDPSYRYGDTQGGIREPHHGVEFQNPAGTPVLAAASGQVIVAGNDWAEQYGPALFFYGNLVVLEADQRFLGVPVYVLYGHLSQVGVHPGQRVEAGEVIGQVGGTGVALGPHLHLEVRVGRNGYSYTRNPELWLRPLTYDGASWGALAGRVLDQSGNRLYSVPVTVRSLSGVDPGPVHRYVFTYASAGLNGDDLLQENFAVSDLPQGIYEVSVNTTRLYRQTVTIEPGRSALIEFRVNPPPPPTSTPSPTP